MISSFNTYRKLLRVEQWYKNLLIFTPLLFPSKVMVLPLPKLVIGFFGFAFISSVTYIINDWVDKDKDKLHPTKKRRPFAAGNISGRQGVMVVLGLLFLVIAVVIYLGATFGVTIALYFVLTNLYSFFLKNIPVLDVILIALNFLLRGVAGLVALNSILALKTELAILFGVIVFFITLKRRADTKLLGSVAVEHKPVLKFYNKKNTYVIRYVSLAFALLALYHKYYVKGLAEYKIAVLITIVAVTGILMSKYPKLALSPHYLLKYWYWVVLIATAFILVLI